MNLSDLLGLSEVLGVVVALALFFFFYFKNPFFRDKVGRLLKFLPSLLNFAASRVEDQKGVFDKHDALVMMGRVSTRISETIEDPANKTFEDVQDEVFEIVRSELDRYKGMPGVPDLNDPTLQAEVRATFEIIQVAMSDDSTGSNS